MPSNHPVRQTVKWIDRGATLLIVVFVGYGLFLTTNARMVLSAPEIHRSEIVSISGGQIDLGVTLSYRWATVRSWEEPSQKMNLLIWPEENRRLWGGEKVLVHVRAGAFGKPWVTKIERDKEHYAREVLKIAPTAATPWRDLVNMYTDRQEMDLAVATAREYLKLHPMDYRFAHNMGTRLRSVRHANDAIFFLEHNMQHQPNYEDAQLLGVAYVRAGQPRKAAAVLEASIPMKPYDWEAYHHLGLIYHDLKRYEDAVAQFDRVLEFIPDFPVIMKMRQRSVEKLAELAVTPQPVGAPSLTATK